MNIIDINNLCFRYDSREVLHDISFHVTPGMFAAMVGPNGGGKTTLLKLILGLLQPCHGSVTVFDKTPEQARTDIGYVPQSIHYDAAFPASVLDIVLMGRLKRGNFGFYSRQDRAVAEECLASVGLAGFGRRPFSALSGGERQRVLIAQALATAPKLLLLDEPAASLDPVSAKQLYSLLQTLNEQLTILMVSHNLEVVSTVVSHVICINHTADIHPVAELPTAHLAGDWLHIRHDTCPVAQACQDLPKHGSCCHHHEH